ncbi:uncharacterized protein RHOBADRAFT_45227 [Rhodotorula graminis WP1]|uniref:Uncharacterized protein n=1 Tax=Rhodotorula graminis (strain WP1) TaxID=578459 RepID=A0A0P9F2D8_RHOGW|nr:uncharacterized protein RHOBADRAFT_45227 [Rhodotorula graminis WP1]KPV73935.1 hypothetical protein RHOBADRAFT_45227 [Rhodotorula graminis WP1]
MDPPPPRASFAPSSTSSLAPSTSPTASRSKSRSITAAPAGTYSTSGTTTRSANAPAAPPTPAGPSSSSSAALLAASTAASPHYTTSLRSRHSLYGTEDRVVLDLGSSVWKVGFSGESQPRACASVVSELARERARGPAAPAPVASAASSARAGAAGGEEGAALWGLEKGEPGEVEWMVREERVKRLLRRLWFEDLMIDPKTRKVIVLENPLLPNRVKEMIARVLFDNLQVPSMGFACSPLLALMAAGAVSGLVVDVGHLETTVLPIFHSRPLFPLLTTTPRAGARLTRRLRSLLLAFASYSPPPSSVNSMTPPTIGRVPRELLTDELVEEIKTRLCFVGEPLPPPVQRGARASSAVSGSAMSLDVPSSPAVAVGDSSSDPDAALVQHLAARYASTAPSTTDVAFRVPTLSQPPVASGVGRGWVQVPGWVRERVAEVLWEEGAEEDEGGIGEGEESGLAGVVLDCLLKLPIDLRKPLASSILVFGGTASMPGFFPRFKASLIAQLERSHPPSPPPSPPLPSSSTSASSPTEDDPMRSSTSPATDAPTPVATAADPQAVAKHRRRRALTLRLHTLRHSPRWAPLAPLAPHLAILNHPSPSSVSTSTSSSASPLLASSLAREREGSAPAFAPALQAWIGGSLAGALKVGGVEVTVLDSLDQLPPPPGLVFEQRPPAFDGLGEPIEELHSTR